MPVDEQLQRRTCRFCGTPIGGQGTFWYHLGPPGPAHATHLPEPEPEPGQSAAERLAAPPRRWPPDVEVKDAAEPGAGA